MSNRTKQPYDVTETRTVYQDKILTLQVDHFTEDGRERTYTRLLLGDWVNVVPLTDNYELLAIRQYRHGAGVWTLEIPAGKIDDGEEPAEAGARELSEETGATFGSLVPLGFFECNPALQNNHVHTYLAFPVAPSPGFTSSEGDAVIVPREEWLSDAFLTAKANLFSTAALLLAKRYLGI